MKLVYKTMSNWPPLAWLAECPLNQNTAYVYHGEKVEIQENWFCEATWDEDFEKGNFDKTDIVVGSGARVRNNKLIFVSSCSNLDRLNFLTKTDSTIISNSLIALLAWSGGEPELSYLNYTQDFANFRYTIFGNHTLSFPSTAGLIRMTYVSNLLWDGSQLVEHEKPLKMRNFNAFNNYKDFLKKTIHRININATNKSRNHPYKLLCSLSKGYDSPTIGTLAKDINNIESFTFSQDREGNDDSGESIAATLEMPCHIYDRNTWLNTSLPEVPFIACSGSVGDLAFKSAEALLQSSVLLSGPTGDTVWSKNAPKPSSSTGIGGGSMLGLTEHRLWIGFINCPVPAWGINQLEDIAQISNSNEMKPWDIEGHYSRPICRRIVETSGVSRTMFGMSKFGLSNTPLTRRTYLHPSSREDLFLWLDEQRKKSQTNGINLPHPQVARILDLIHSPLAQLSRVLKQITSRRPFKRLKSLALYIDKSLWRPYYHHNYLVHWAINRAKKQYTN